jgi:hypothetical protein
MELKELLETVHRLIDKIGQAKKSVEFCEDCKGEITQQEHQDKHLEEALRIRDKLPHSLVWSFGSLKVIPKITITFDGEGHATANLDKVKIY